MTRALKRRIYQLATRKKRRDAGLKSWASERINAAARCPLMRAARELA